MATELGVAYLSLSASTKDFAKDVKAALKDVEVDAGTTGKKSGKFLGGGITKGLKVGTVAIAAMAATVGALAIKGGISRALSIEDAQAKLVGLGHDTKSVEKIMENAMNAVKGTAYGFGDAAGLAGTMVAAGIKPGKDLEDTLKRVADSATIAGTDLGDMGMIWGKTAAKGKVDGQIINQMLERQIPIYDILGARMGKSAEEIATMVSKGKISFEDFSEAMNDNIGGAALDSGKTTRGAWANMLAALSRIGEKLVAKVLPKAREFFNAMIQWADKIAPAAEKAGEWLGDALVKFGGFLTTTVAPAVQTLGKALMDRVVPALKSAGDWIVKNQAWLKPLAAALLGAVVAMEAVFVATRIWAAAQLALNAAMALNPIGLIIIAVAGLVAGIAYLWKTNEGFRNFFIKAWEKIQSAVAVVVDWWQKYVAPTMSMAWDAILSAARSVMDWYSANVAPVIGAVVDLVIAYVERMAAVWGWLWNTILQPYLSALLAYWGVIWDGVKAVWDVVGEPLIDWIGAAWQNVAAVLTMVWKNIKITIETALAVIKGIINTVTAVIKGDWSGAWTAIKKTTETIWNGLKASAANIWNAIKTIFSNVWSAIKSIVTSYINAVKSVVSSVLNSIKSVVSNAWNGVKSTTSNAWNAIKTAVTSGVTNVINVIKGLPGKALSALSNIGSTLTGAGKKLIQGFIDGIKDMFGSVKDTLGGLTNALTSWKGPPEKDATLLKGAGQLIIGGFIDGLESEYGAARKSLGKFTNDIAGTKFNGLTMPSATGMTLNSSVSSGLSSHVGAGSLVKDTPVTASDKGGDGPRIQVTNHFPQAEPTSVTVNKAQQFAAAMGV